jgi:membrane protease YdiL (CAAX protease family)
MEYLPPEEEPVRKPWIDRFQAFLEVLLLSGLISSFLAGLPFSVFHKNSTALLKNASYLSVFLILDSLITFLFLAIVLKAHRQTILGLGLRFNQWKSKFIAGLVLAPFLFLINAIIALVFRAYLPHYYVERNPLTEIIQTPQQLGLFIFSALIAGGIKEELQRAFILRRFGEYLGGTGIGLVLWSIVFGLGHYVQGVQGVVVASLYGFIFGIAYLLTRSLITPIVAHSAYDTLALLGYWFFSGRS